jgi:hypothetical protein
MRAFVLALFVAVLAGSASAAPSSGGVFTLTREGIVSGGLTASGGAYRLESSTAQPAAADQAGAEFRLRGGFQVPAGAAGSVFSDGFED